MQGRWYERNIVFAVPLYKIYFASKFFRLEFAVLLQNRVFEISTKLLFFIMLRITYNTRSGSSGAYVCSAAERLGIYIPFFSSISGTLRMRFMISSLEGLIGDHKRVSTAVWNGVILRCLTNQLNDTLLQGLLLSSQYAAMD